MKWFLIIVLICVIMLISYSVSEQYKDKFDFYTNLKLFLQQFKLNLSFKQEKINSFLDNLKPKKQFKEFIDSYKTFLKAGKLDLKNLKLFDSEELKELESIIINIGNYDVTSEKNQLDAFMSTVDIKLLKAQENKNKLCPMIIKLSLLFAIGLAIILI